MFFIFGDIHGSLEVSKVVNYMNKTNYTSNDFIILLGDVGVCWDNSWKDDEVISELQSINCMKLFIDGNHECFPLLYSYPEYKWCNGYVHEIREDILHLQRGYIFDINGIKFFTFGGAYSIDKQFRTEGADWWREELPNEKEIERGWQVLKKHNYDVDYILTHTAPYEVAVYMNKELNEEEYELYHFLQEVADNVYFNKWFFGHFHDDEVVEDNYICVYDKVHTIKN